ncbi:MAG: hypothetical protein ACRBM6_08765 [Geminicoccales bacterium]
MMVRAIVFVTLAVLMVLLVAYTIATGERRGDPMSYAVGTE